MNIIILTGGVGKRLWPLGRQNNPKQFFPIISRQPLVKETYNRFLRVYGPSKIFLSTTEDLLPFLKKIFPRLPSKQFLVEPSRRDTGPAMGLVALKMFLQDPDEPMVFVPSDHFVSDVPKYLRCFKIGEELIKKTSRLVDIGITATFPSTVLGYTKIGSAFQKKQGIEVFNFAGHTEKPDFKTAARYLANGHYLWHGNYYMWTPRLFLQALQTYAPEIGSGLEKIKIALAKKETARIKQLYQKLPQVSFDYAVTEKINQRQVLIIKGDFGWSDIGAWDVLHNQLKKESDKSGNVTKGLVLSQQTKNCLLYSQSKKVLAAIGLEEMIVVDTNDALLVCPKNRAQEVKKILELIEQQGWHKYL